MKLLFASSNRGKSVEMLEVAAEYSQIELVTADQLPGPVPQVEEDALNYEGNARLKAQAYYRWSGMSSVADDTGLEVAALGGVPGVNSARYAGEPSDPKRNIEKLLAAMRGVTDRRARFVCVLVALLKGDIELKAFGTIEGEITYETRGEGGFGYDCLFLPNGSALTLAELKAARSPIITHRISAAHELFRKITDRA